MSRYIPDRGDVINLSFDPALGREQNSLATGCLPEELPWLRSTK